MSNIDPDIARTVAWLQNRGFVVDSCRASNGGDLRTCSVTIRPSLHGGLMATASRLADALQAHGVAVDPGDVQAIYDPADGSERIYLNGIGDATLFGRPEPLPTDAEPLPMDHFPDRLAVGNVTNRAVFPMVFDGKPSPGARPLMCLDAIGPANGGEGAPIPRIGLYESWSPPYLRDGYIAVSLTHGVYTPVPDAAFIGKEGNYVVGLREAHEGQNR